jgi:hypothetical protein
LRSSTTQTANTDQGHMGVAYALLAAGANAGKW